MKPPQEWLSQAEYDMETAEYMLSGGRTFYAVFMCHLSIEKALKGLYTKTLSAEPPKVHHLARLCREMSLQLPTEIGTYVAQLDQRSVATRYPEDLAAMHRAYPKEFVERMLAQGKEILAWIKAKC